MSARLQLAASFMSRPWHRHRLRAALWCLPNLADAMSLVQHAAARAMPRGPVAHIAEHFTIAGKKLLAVHANWIGRYDRRGVKLQHGSVLFI